MNIDQIAAEAAEEWLKPAGLGDPLLTTMRNELAAIIKAAIEKALKHDDEKWRERERKFKLIVEKFGYPRAAHASEQPQTIGEYMQAEQNMGAAHGNKPKRKRSGAGGGQAEQRCLRCGVTHRVGSPHECQPAHASTKRHHYQAEDGFPCPCGKPIDHPIHIPRIEL